MANDISISAIKCDLKITQLNKIIAFQIFFVNGYEVVSKLNEHNK